MLDLELWHRKVLRVTGRKPSAYGGRGCRDQAVTLGEGDAFSLKVPAPPSGQPSLGLSERHHTNAGDQSFGSRPFVRPQAARNLLDVDGADVRSVPGSLEPVVALLGAREAAQQIDEYRGVEEDVRHLPDAARVDPSLRGDPGGRVIVPLVTIGRNRSDCRPDQPMPPLIVERARDGTRDERASLARANVAIEFPNELVVQCNV